MAALTPTGLAAERLRNREVLIGVAASVLWIILASLTAGLIAVISIGTAIGSYLREEPEFAPPIEWRSLDEWRDFDIEVPDAARDPVVFIRLESDGSAWVENFPVTTDANSPWAWFLGQCFEGDENERYSGEARWTNAYGGGINISVSNRSTRVSPGSLNFGQDWRDPSIPLCGDPVFDIDFELVCGDSGLARLESWTLCEPLSG